MTTNVEPEEVRAILDLDAQDAQRPTDVVPRDFGQPIRLSPEELETVRLRLRQALPAAEAELARALRSLHPLELVEAGEVNVEGLFAGAEEPLAVVRFEVGGQPGWLVWEPGAALAAIEVCLGATEVPDTEPRDLSSVERSVMVRVLSAVLRGFAEALKVELENPRAPEIVDDLGSWRDGGEAADRRRLCAHVSFEGPGGPSALRIYFPGIDPAQRRERNAGGPPALPRHLEQVKVAIAARLGQSEIPLSELLSIEPGDVIPLATAAHEPLDVYLEDRLCARGALGSHHGNLAVQITEVGPEEQEQ